MLSSRFRSHSAMLAAVLLAGIGNGMSPAFPVDDRIPTVSTVAPRRRFSSRYPFASARQMSRDYETVVGRNGHATMRRVA